MKRKICAFALILALSSTVSVYAAPYSILIDNTPVSFTQSSGQPFLDENERTQVPLRLTMESFGCSVSWNETAKTAIVEKDDIIIKVPIGENHILINGVKKETDASAMIKDGRTYLPIRAVLEAFGATVRWMPHTNTILVTSANPATGILTVHFIDVGQADAILIDNGTFEVLIDGGNNKDGQNVVAYLADYVDGALELVIASHPDADHIGGLDDVFSAYDIVTLIDSGDTKDTKTYQDYWNAVISEANCKILYDDDMIIDIGNGARLEIIETGDGYKNTNDNSVVALLTYGSTTVLFTGDMEKEAEAASLTRYGKVTVLKMGHHGSKTSSSQAFLDLTNPDYVIISAGAGNSYKHPHQETLQRALAVDATIYGTFKSGTIIMTTDGKNVRFNTTNKINLSDAGDYTG